MKAVMLFLVAAMAASQALGQGVTVTTVRRGGANLGLLSSFKSKCSKADPKKATFGWAHSGVLLPSETVPGSTGGATGNRCFDVCGLGYRLAAVFSPPNGPPREPPFPSGPPPPPADTTHFLCRIKRKTTSTPKPRDETLYGYYTQASDVCKAYSPVDEQVVIQSVDDGFDCGCCGTINRDGQRWERGCEKVTASVSEAGSCPRGIDGAPKPPKGQAPEPGTEICTKESDTAGEDDLWGTIDPQNRDGQCFVAPSDSEDGDTTPLDNLRDYNRFCYKINPYSGPPTPDCKDRNP